MLGVFIVIVTAVIGTTIWTVAAVALTLRNSMWLDTCNECGSLVDKRLGCGFCQEIESAK